MRSLLLVLAVGTHALAPPPFVARRRAEQIKVYLPQCPRFCDTYHNFGKDGLIVGPRVKPKGLEEGDGVCIKYGADSFDGLGHPYHYACYEMEEDGKCPDDASPCTLVEMSPDTDTCRCTRIHGADPKKTQDMCVTTYAYEGADKGELYSDDLRGTRICEPPKSPGWERRFGAQQPNGGCQHPALPCAYAPPQCPGDSVTLDGVVSMVELLEAWELCTEVRMSVTSSFANPMEESEALTIPGGKGLVLESDQILNGWLGFATGGGTLTHLGQLEITGGYPVFIDDGTLTGVEGGGDLITDGEIDVGQGGTLTAFGNINNDGNIIVNGGTLTHYGEIEGATNIEIYGGGAVTTKSGGTIKFDATLDVGADGSEGTLNVEPGGKIKLVATGATDSLGGITDPGTSGKINIEGEIDMDVNQACSSDTCAGVNEQDLPLVVAPDGGFAGRPPEAGWKEIGFKDGSGNVVVVGKVPDDDSYVLAVVDGVLTTGCALGFHQEDTGGCAANI